MMILASRSLKFRWGNNINVKHNFRKGNLIEIKRCFGVCVKTAARETQSQEALDLCSVGLQNGGDL